jgi:hypothetical protein
VGIVAELGVWKVGGDWTWWARLLEIVAREECKAEREVVRAGKCY